MVAVGDTEHIAREFTTVAILGENALVSVRRKHLAWCVDGEGESGQWTQVA